MGLVSPFVIPTREILDGVNLILKGFWKMEETKKKIIKIGKDKVEIRPYILTTEATAITNLCVKRTESDFSGHANLPLVHSLFDMLVVHFCTNIIMKGIGSKKNDGTLEINVEITSDDIDKFDESGIIETIAPHIRNYNECYADIVKTIEMNSVSKAIYSITDSFPNVDKIATTLKDSVKELSDIKEKDPELFKQVLNEAAKQPIVEEARKESQNNKKKKKSDGVHK